MKCHYSFSALVTTDYNNEITNKIIKLLKYGTSNSLDISQMLSNELHPVLSIKFLIKGDVILLCHFMVVNIESDNLDCLSSQRTFHVSVGLKDAHEYRDIIYILSLSELAFKFSLLGKVLTAFTESFHWRK